MKSGDRLSDMQDVATVRVAEERLAAKKQRNYWRTEKRCTKLKKALVNGRYPYLRRHCAEDFLELVLDPVPKQKLFNVLQIKKYRLRGIESCDALVCYVLTFGMYNINNFKVKELWVILCYRFRS